MSQNIDYSKGIYDARQLGAGRMLILGVQHMFAMFGATVLVPLLTGLSVSTTLLCAGLGTLLFHFITKGKVPAFLGSSFAYLGGFSIVAPMLAGIVNALGVINILTHYFLLLSAAQKKRHYRGKAAMPQKSGPNRKRKIQPMRAKDDFFFSISLSPFLSFFGIV